MDFPPHKGCDRMISISDKEFTLLSEFIQKNYGIHLKKEKQTLLTGRLHKVLSELGFNNFTDYYNYLITDKSGKAIAEFVDKITTNHTFFMREPDHFVYFRDQVLPYLKSTVKGNDLRIWCAASSTGEEPYTLAMIIKDFFERDFMAWDTKLLATDISQAALETAKKGIYPNERTIDLPNIWKTKYFNKIDANNMVVKEQIKNEVIYRRFNLVDDVFPFRKKFHVIFCRNVMIYFDNKTKETLINKMYDLLEDGGYLFIGHSESLNRETTPFKYIRPAVYRKI